MNYFETNRSLDFSSDNLNQTSNNYLIYFQSDNRLRFEQLTIIVTKM